MCDIMTTHTRHSLLRKGLLISGTYSLLYIVFGLYILLRVNFRQQRANSSDISRWMERKSSAADHLAHSTITFLCCGRRLEGRLRNTLKNATILQQKPDWNFMSRSTLQNTRTLYVRIRSQSAHFLWPVLKLGVRAVHCGTGLACPVTSFCVAGAGQTGRTGSGLSFVLNNVLCKLNLLQNFVDVHIASTTFSSDFILKKKQQN